MRSAAKIRLRWSKAYRIVSSRYPPVSLLDRVTDPDDLAIVLDVEGLSNARLRDEVGEIQRVPPAQRVCGPGATPIMAAFTHLSAAGSRFTNGSFGVFYCAHRQDTAVAETVYHRERFLRDGEVGPVDLDMRCYVTGISGQLRDVRGEGFDAVHDPASYVASQAMAVSLRGVGAGGIVYRSVRDPGGECVAAFTPKLVAPCVQGEHFIYRWDGARISVVLNVTAVERR